MENRDLEKVAFMKSIGYSVQSSGERPLKVMSARA